VNPERLGIVIVNWNGRRLLEACLRSVYEDPAGRAAMVCVVDNASQDESAAMVKERFAAVRLVESATNLGFAKACNLGLKELGAADAVLFLNPDAAAQGRAISRMLACLRARPDAGAVTCALIDGRGRFQEAQGHRLPSPRTAFNQYFFLSRLSDALFPGIFLSRRPSGTAEVEWISGAAMMVRGAALDGSPFFNEEYFMYAEDMEASLTLRRKGWKLLFISDAEMVHHVKQSTSRTGPRIFNTQVSSQLLFFRKHYSSREAWSMRWIMAAGHALRLCAHAVLGLARGQAAHRGKAASQWRLLRHMLGREAACG